MLAAVGRAYVGVYVAAALSGVRLRSVGVTDRAHGDVRALFDRARSTDGGLFVAVSRCASVAPDPAPVVGSCSGGTDCGRPHRDCDRGGRAIDVAVSVVVASRQSCAASAMPRLRSADRRRCGLDRCAAAVVAVASPAVAAWRERSSAAVSEGGACIARASDSARRSSRCAVARSTAGAVAGAPVTASTGAAVASEDAVRESLGTAFIALSVRAYCRGVIAAVADEAIAACDAAAGSLKVAVAVTGALLGACFELASQGFCVKR